MISAMLLICADLGMGEPYCTTVASPEILYTTEECLTSLSFGMVEAESLGWTVIDYTCYNWDTQETLKDFMNDST